MKKQRLKKTLFSKFLSVALAIILCAAAAPFSAVAADTASASTSVSYPPLLIAVDMGYEHENAANGQGVNGMCYIIRLSDGSFILVDGGWNDETICNRIYETLKTYAPDPNRIVIAAWFITHPHMDHYGAIQYMADRQDTYSGLVVVQIIRSFPSASYLSAKGLTDKVAAFETAIAKFKKNSDGDAASVYSIADKLSESNTTFAVRGNTVTPLFWVDDAFTGTEGDSGNETSLVFKLAVGGKTLLFTGDMPLSIAGELLQDEDLDLTADYYQIPHHGFKDSSSSDTLSYSGFYSKVNAATVLLPVSASKKTEVLGYADNAYFQKEGITVIASDATTAISLKDGTTPQWVGAGSEANPYRISNLTDLQALNSSLAANSTTHTGVYFKQTADIDCGGASVRIGTSGKKFGGTYDGGGYKITNMVQKNVSGTPTGLFSSVDGGTVCNLTLQNATVETTAASNTPRAGGIVGFAENNTVIKNCHVMDCTVKANHDAGGIVGSITGGSVEGCTVTASTVTAGSHVGGIAALAKDAKISYCVNSSAVLLEAAYDVQKSLVNFEAGGILGYSNTGNTVSYCINYGKVSAKIVGSASGTRIFSAGGISGYASSDTYSNCYNAGAVTGAVEPDSQDSNSTAGQRLTVGGITGRVRSKDATVQNCCNLNASLTVTGSGTNSNIGVINGFVNSGTLTANENHSVALDNETAGTDITYSTASNGKLNSANSNNTYLTLADMQAATDAIDAEIRENRTANFDTFYQTRTETDGTVTIRFLQGLDKLESYQGVTFKITATYKKDGSTVTERNGGKLLTTGYTAVNAAGESCTALQMGTNYFAAMAVTGVPANTEIAFEVKAYVLKTDKTDFELLNSVSFTLGAD